MFLYYRKFCEISTVYKDYKLVAWYLNVQKYSKNSWHPLALTGLAFIYLTIIFGTIFVFWYDIITDAINVYHRSKLPKDSIHFESIPFSIQYRFYQLQSPLIRYNLVKAYPTKWLLNAANILVVDSLEIDQKNLYQLFRIHLFQKIINAEPNWNIDGSHKGQAYNDPWDQLNFRIKNVKVTEILWFQKIFPLKSAIFTSLTFDQLPVIFEKCDLSNISRLEIISSTLNSTDLSLIGTLGRLQFIRLCLTNANGNEKDFVVDLLKSLVGIPNNKIFIKCFYDDSYMEPLIVEWILEYGYIKTFFFTFRYDFNENDDRKNYITFASELVPSFTYFNYYKTK